MQDCLANDLAGICMEFSLVYHFLIALSKHESVFFSFLLSHSTFFLVLLASARCEHHICRQKQPVVVVHSVVFLKIITDIRMSILSLLCLCVLISLSQLFTQ